MTVISVTGWAPSVPRPQPGEDVFPWQWQSSALGSDACRGGGRSQAPRAGLSLKLTSPRQSIFSTFPPCDLRVKDQGASCIHAVRLPITLT